MNAFLTSFVLAAASLNSLAAESPQPLPKLNIDPARITVSGLSSGAYMAQQVHFVFSSHISGAALLAGGPYGCAEGKLETALARCLNPKDGGPDVKALAGEVRARAQAGKIDPLSGLKGDQVWIYHGSRDSVVGAQITAASADIYRELASGAKVTTDTSHDTEHLFPTATAGGDCSKAVTPFIGKCGFDAASAIFMALYSKTKNAAAEPSGDLLAFDQKPFAAADADPSLGAIGFVYLPKQCHTGKCGLHISFHGCLQSAEQIGRVFVEQTGYNRWADAASVVVLYPQTHSTMAPLNPKACWDWWGYTGPGYDTKQGAQMRWLANVVAALGGTL